MDRISTLRDLNQFMRFQESALSSFKERGSTPQVQDFERRLKELDSLRHSVGARSGDGNLPADQVGRISQMADQIRQSRVDAWKSQQRTEATARRTPETGRTGTGTENDPYKKSNGKVYRDGPSGQDVRFNKDTLTREGDRGEGVRTWQEQFKRAGYDLGNYGPNKDGVDGLAGPKFRAARDAFLAKHPDLNGRMDMRAFQRLAAEAEGNQSGRVGNLIHNGVDNAGDKPTTRPVERVPQRGVRGAIVGGERVPVPVERAPQRRSTRIDDQ